MKKKSLSLIAFLFLFIITSCQGFLGDRKSGLTVRLPGTKHSRTLGTDGSDLFFTILCESEDKTISIPKEGESGDEVIFEELPPGKYTIYGEAYSDEEKTILKYKGQTTAVVTSGINTPVQLILSLVDGGSGSGGSGDEEEEEIFTYSYIASGDDILYLDDYFNSIELTQYKTVDGGLVETGVTSRLSTLASTYNVYIGGSLVNSSGKLEDNSDAIKSFIGKTHISIKDKDDESNIIEDFDINIELDGIDIAVYEGGSEKDFSTLVITEDNIESLTFKPLYSHSGAKYSLDELPIKKAFDVSTGTEIAGFTLNSNSYWQWISNLVTGTENSSGYTIIKSSITDLASDVDDKDFNLSCSFIYSNLNIKTDTAQKENLVFHKKKLEIVIDGAGYGFGRNYLGDIQVKEYYLVDSVKNYITDTSKYLVDYVNDYDIYVGNDTTKVTETFSNKEKYYGGVPIKITEKGNITNTLYNKIAKVFFTDISIYYSVSGGSGSIDEYTSFTLDELKGDPEFSVIVSYYDDDGNLQAANTDNLDTFFNSSGEVVAEPDNMYNWTFTYASENISKTNKVGTLTEAEENSVWGGLEAGQFFTIDFTIDVTTLGFNEEDNQKPLQVPFSFEIG